MGHEDVEIRLAVEYAFQHVGAVFAPVDFIVPGLVIQSIHVEIIRAANAGRGFLDCISGCGRDANVSENAAPLLHGALKLGVLDLDICAGVNLFGEFVDQTVHIIRGKCACGLAVDGNNQGH